MKVFAIADLHLDETNSKPMDVFGDVWAGQKEDILKSIEENGITEGDVVVVAGDISWAMKLEDAKTDLNFLRSFPCRVVILRGNHDYWWSTISAVRAAIPPNVHAIQNDAEKIGGIIFCGTRGWNVPETGKKQKEDDEKIFKREAIRLGLTLDAAKKLQTADEPIVLIMHYPPFNNRKEDNEFLSIIKKAGIKTVIFGHLHGKYHGCTYQTTIEGTDFYLTSCDFLKNKITQIDVKN